MTARLVILNDDPPLLEVCQDVLEEEGLEVQTRVQELFCVEEIAELGPDLVIPDYFFGHEDKGFQFL